MGTLHFYFMCVGLIANCMVTLVKSVQREDDRENLMHRLSAIEATLGHVLEINHELVKRNKQLEKRIDAIESAENRDDKRTSAANTKLKNKRQLQIQMYTVAFTAVIHPHDLHNLVAGQTLIYDKVITNVGGAYQNNTGVFTAPYHGVYIFNFAEMVNPSYNEYTELVKNGQLVMMNFAHSGGAHYASSSRTTTLELKRGDQVWVRTRAASGAESGTIHGYDFTTFSGWIIYIAE